MKKHFTKLLSVLLAVVLTVSLLPIATQAAAVDPPYPVIRVTGGQASLTNYETGEQYFSAFDLNMDALKVNMAEIQEPLIEALKGLRWEEAAHLLGQFMQSMFGELAVYPDGTSKNALYRTGTQAVPGYDDTAYITPKREVPPPETTTEPPTTEPPVTEPPSSTEPPPSTEAPEPEPTPGIHIPEALVEAWNKVLETLSNALKPIGDRLLQFVDDLGVQLENAVIGIQTGTDEYKEENGYTAKQPEPDPAWDNVDSLNLKNGVNCFWFTFDWRQSPLQVADQLNDYIKAVKAYTGADKVYVQCQSMSTSTGMVYLDRYVNGNANPDIAGIFFSQSMGNGSDVFGSVLSKKIWLDATALANSKDIYGFVDIPEEYQALLKVLHNTGLLDLVLSILPLLPASFIDTVFEEALIPTYASFPSMWALVPAEMYNEAKSATWGDRVNDPAYASFFAQIDGYYNIQKRSNAILQEAAENVKVAVLAGFGRTAWPIASQQGAQGDQGVDTKYASYGATVLNLGQVFPDSYKQKVNDGHDHISPDKTVDASTCALPENTWFVNDVRHQNFLDWGGLAAWWMTTDNPTVFSSERWPQFLRSTTGDETVIYPLLAPVYETSDAFVKMESFWNSFLSFWSKLLYFLTGTTSKAVNFFARLGN
ncbi:MAG: hypothetical protein LBQ80_00720 [Clostridium sp.]|jgi:hypothetical protein|nr:hypothetical protein [Clostridium sp.]